MTCWAGSMKDGLYPELNYHKPWQGSRALGPVGVGGAIAKPNSSKVDQGCGVGFHCISPNLRGGATGRQDLTTARDDGLGK